MSRSAADQAVFALVCACLGGPALACASQPTERTPQAQADYMLNCMGCHIADGSGAAGKVPSVRDSLVPLASSVAGRRYLVQVPGSAQSRLSNLQLAQVLSWMVRNLSAQPVPRSFVNFTEAEVADYRRTPLVDVRATRARLLAASTGRVPAGR